MISAPSGQGYELLKWNEVSQGLPDSEITVLAFSPNADDPVWLMFHDGEQWRYVDAMPTTLEVTHWADMPVGPKPK